MVAVQQGEIYWVDFGEPRSSAPALRRTTVVCVITSNLARAGAPGNVRLAQNDGCAVYPEYAG